MVALWFVAQMSSAHGACLAARLSLRFALAHLEGGLCAAKGDAVAKDGVACRRLRPPHREPLIGANQERLQRLAYAAALAGVAPDLRECRATRERPGGQHIGSSQKHVPKQGVLLEGVSADHCDRPRPRCAGTLQVPCHKLQLGRQWALLSQCCEVCHCRE